MKFTRGVRAGIALSIALLGMSAMSVPHAVAAITSSTINTPNGGVYRWYDEAAPTGGALTLTGTFTGTATATDFVCTRVVQGSFGSSNTDSNLPFAASPFTYSTSGAGGIVADIAQAGTHSGLCHIRLIENGMAIDALSVAPFSGPILYVATRQQTFDTGRQVSYDMYAPQSRGHAWLEPFGSCGVTNLRLVSGDSISGYLFGCNDYIWDGAAPPPAGANTPLMTVDGDAVYSSDSNPGRALPGFVAMSETVTHRSTNGSLLVSETAPLFSCAPVATFPAGGGCTSYAGSGVVLKRRIETAANGRRVLFTDQFMSTDRAAHTVSLYTEENMGGPDNGLQLPGSTFLTYPSAVNQPIALAGRPGRILSQFDHTGSPTGSFDDPVGAITFGTLPDHVLVGTAARFLPHHSFTVPATGSRELRRVYTIGESLTELSSGSAWELDWTVTPTGVRITGKSKRNIRSNRFPVTVACPSTERTCAGTIVARYKGRRVGSVRLSTVAGGRSRTATMRLSGAAKRRLLAGRSVRLGVTLTGADGAANPFTVKRTITVR